MSKLKTSHQMVEEFHKAFGHPISKEPDLTKKNVSDPVLKLRMNLIAEEFFELVEAVYSKSASDAMQASWDETMSMVDSEPKNRDVVEAADALADMEYVIHGFAHVSGIPLPDVMEEVHASNMSKLGPDGKPIYREDGKVLKGPDYFRPDVAKVMGLAESKSTSKPKFESKSDPNSEEKSKKGK